jgi:hypothetical protein
LKRIAHLRWWIVVLICAGTIANYLARNSLGMLAPQLKVTFSMSTEQYGYVDLGDRRAQAGVRRARRLLPGARIVAEVRTLA